MYFFWRTRQAMGPGSDRHSPVRTARRPVRASDCRMVHFYRQGRRGISLKRLERDAKYETNPIPYPGTPRKGSPDFPGYPAQDFSIRALPVLHPERLETISDYGHNGVFPM